MATNKEGKLQAKIISYLKTEKWIVVKTIMLSKGGYPDIFAFKNGISIFIEVKSPSCKPTELQQNRIDLFVANKFNAFYADSFEMFMKKYSNFES